MRGTISPPIRRGKREAARRDFAKRTESGWVAETGEALRASSFSVGGVCLLLESRACVSGRFCVGSPCTLVGELPLGDGEAV